MWIFCKLILFLALKMSVVLYLWFLHIPHYKLVFKNENKFHLWIYEIVFVFVEIVEILLNLELFRLTKQLMTRLTVLFLWFVYFYHKPCWIYSWRNRISACSINNKYYSTFTKHELFFIFLKLSSKDIFLKLFDCVCIQLQTVILSVSVLAKESLHYTVISIMCLSHKSIKTKKASKQIIFTWFIFCAKISPKLFA